jgi:predicted AlkP superfamily pyrophosphatase or phosphodiesterase
MVKPDYNNSILNLINTIIYLGNGQPKYDIFDDYKKFKDKKNIVLFVIDGLGYHYIKEHAQNSFLAKYLDRKVTSVFPSTTASAITTYVSGLPPEKHGLTGWFMYLKEIGAASLALPFSPRYDWGTYAKYDINITDVYDFPNITSQINRESYAIVVDYLKDSDYTSYFCGSAEKFGYNNLNEYFLQTLNAINNSDNSKFVYSYWSVFDKKCHQLGTNHPEVHAHFQEIDTQFETFINNMPEDTICFISADHGLLNCKKESQLHINDFPDIKETLLLPLCGEPRNPYCYINFNEVDKFKSLVSSQLGHACEIVPANDMISQQFFGTGSPEKKFMQRIGHFNLLMKEDYALFDNVLGETPAEFVGLHGGTTKEEMEVPIFVIEK